jgi:hypothetical protein
VLLVLPFAVYFIALAAAFTSSEGALWAACFAVGVLATAELAWWLVNIKQSPLRESAKYAAFYILLAMLATWTLQFFQVASYSVVEMVCFAAFIICLLRGQKVYQKRLGRLGFGRALYAGGSYTVLSAACYGLFLYLFLTFLIWYFSAHSVHPIDWPTAMQNSGTAHTVQVYLGYTFVIGLLTSVTGFFLWRKSGVTNR